jgi:Spy/CpxP family protein refolding chaperone
MDALTSVQRQRLGLFAREQQDLARFLTPVQRAKYATLQAHLRKRVESLRERRQENRLSASERRRLRALRRSGMSAPE